MNRLPKLLFTICLLCISACNTQNVQPTKGSQSDLADVLELQQKAEEAYAKEDWRTAELAYQKLTQEIPREAEPWFYLGNIYARTDRNDVAIYAYRESLRRDAKNSRVWHNLGIAQLREASRTFAELEQMTQPDDMLHKRAEQVVKTMTQLMKQDFNASVTE